MPGSRGLWCVHNLMASFWRWWLISKLLPSLLSSLFSFSSFPLPLSLPPFLLPSLPFSIHHDISCQRWPVSFHCTLFIMIYGLVSGPNKWTQVSGKNIVPSLDIFFPLKCFVTWSMENWPTHFWRLGREEILILSPCLATEAVISSNVWGDPSHGQSITTLLFPLNFPKLNTGLHWGKASDFHKSQPRGMPIWTLLPNSSLWNV